MTHVQTGADPVGTHRVLAPAGALPQTAARLDTRADDAWPYGPPVAERGDVAGRTELQLIPYHRWAERGPSRMRVWLPLA